MTKLLKALTASLFAASIAGALVTAERGPVSATRQLLTRTGSLDFDGDGHAEIAIVRPSVGTWYLLNPVTGVSFPRFGGTQVDLVTPGDFDGDGKIDATIWRSISGDFVIVKSTNLQFQVFPWGLSGDDTRVVADHDGDGRTDFVVFRTGVTPGAPAFFYIFQSSTASFRAIQWGKHGDVAVIGDYDGDGRDDAAVYRPSDGFYYVLGTTAGFTAQQWGVFATDYVTPGDYDGDGKTDFAVYRFDAPESGVWWVKQSSNGAVVPTQFGLSTDVPVPADYDGDGKTDLAVVRARAGVWTWYIRRSATGTLQAFVFGLATDYPVPFYLVR